MPPVFPVVLVSHYRKQEVVEAVFWDKNAFRAYLYLQACRQRSVKSSKVRNVGNVEVERPDVVVDMLGGWDV